MANEKIAPALVDMVVPISELHQDPQNARLHNDKNIQAVCRSLEMYGQQKPVVVDADGKILAGNGTVQAAQKLGWESVARVVSDLEDHKSKMGYSIADNRTSDLAGWDYDVLTRQLNELADDGVKSAGDMAFTDVDLANIIGDPNNSVKDETLDLIEEKALAAERESAMIQLPDFDMFEADNALDIPELKLNMISAPDGDIKTWVSKTKSGDKDSEDQWWFKLWGRSESGAPPERSIVAFYTWDKKFEAAWDRTGDIAYWMLSNGCKYAIVPNFSGWNWWPKAQRIWDHYRAQWVGRYLQECGIQVIPDINPSSQDRDIYMLGIPKNAPVVCMQAQTVDDEQWGWFIEELGIIIETLNPQSFLFYTGKRGKKVIEGVGLDRPYRIIDSISVEVGEYFKEQKSGSNSQPVHRVEQPNGRR